MTKNNAFQDSDSEPEFEVLRNSQLPPATNGAFQAYHTLNYPNALNMPIHASNGQPMLPNHTNGLPPLNNSQQQPNNAQQPSVQRSTTGTSTPQLPPDMAAMANNPEFMSFMANYFQQMQLQQQQQAQPTQPSLQQQPQHLPTSFAAPTSGNQAQPQPLNSVAHQSPHGSGTATPNLSNFATGYRQSPSFNGNQTPGNLHYPGMPSQPQPGFHPSIHPNQPPQMNPGHFSPQSMFPNGNMRHQSPMPYPSAAHSPSPHHQQAMPPSILPGRQPLISNAPSQALPAQNHYNSQPSQTPITRSVAPSHATPHTGPRKEIYILVLGETGVGKSTWINGIANYMSYNEITEALEAPEPICVIPSKFTMCDDNYQQREIVIGTSTNEVFGKGQSATQDARTYLFQTPKYDVYIIDTPGIGDVRGVEKDRENTRKILNAIAPYKNLHAVCLLFKANDSRLTLSFRYCISEILLQLHKDAVDNIVFFFTNARGTFYRPGETMTLLREFLQQLKEKHDISVAIDKQNTFCLDNEAFKFVCAYHDGVDFSEEDMLNFASSWKKSAEETHRFLDYAAERPPHLVDKTLSVNQARGIILQLAKPLADINDLIETNIKVFNDRKSEIENTAATIDELKQKLLIPQVGITTEPLTYPMTVCTGKECIETQSIPNSEQLQTIYKQICHDHCQLDNVDAERFPEPNLQQCWAMQGTQTCTQCGCPWSVHMHIRFKQVKTSASVEDPNIKNAIQTNEDARITKQKIIDSCEKTVDEYKLEQKVIMDASIRFAVFLKQNAIMTYNDVFEKYVEKSIEEEEKCIQAGGDRSKLESLKRCLNEYLQERSTIEHAMNDSNKTVATITTEDVQNLKKELFALPHFGAKLKELFNRTVQGLATNQNASIQRFTKPTFNSHQSGNYQYPQKRKNHNSGVMKKLRNVFKP